MQPILRYASTVFIYPAVTNATHTRFLTQYSSDFSRWVQLKIQLGQLAFSGYPDWGFSVVFPQLEGKCQGIPRKDGARPALFLISELCCSVYCLCRLCCSMYCLCVNVYCTTATGCQPNCCEIYHIYHIISYHIISYHIISYHIISYHISYISYHIIYHIISYIISYIMSCHNIYRIVSYINE
jgi:hypothetical protein